MLQKHYPYLFFTLLLGLCLFLTLNLHSRLGMFTYQSEIWADRAGYYVYLPATFMAGYNFEKFPEGIDARTGDGFHLDSISRKVETKYTYGVALMLTPSFLTTWAISGFLHQDPVSGFSLLFHRMIDVTAALYLVFGLFLLFRVLSKQFSRPLSLFLVFLALAGTNLFYYGLRDSLMSHVYSFFLFCLFLFALQKYLESKGYRWFLVLCVSGALATIIRPTDIILFSLLFLWNVGSRASLAERAREILTRRNLATFLAILFLVALPQMLYWKYAFGQFIHYTYQEEGFRYLARPHLLKVWFAPLNGLFIYTPLYFLMVIGMLYGIISRKPNSWLILGLFFTVSYLCASWSSWYFGCGFGQRPFVQYLPLFIIPLGYLTDYFFRQWSGTVSVVFVFLMLLMSFYNIRLSFTYKYCFYGSTWEWPQYTRTLWDSGLNPARRPSWAFYNDFENDALSGPSPRCKTHSRSGDFSCQLDRTHEYGATFEKYRWQFHSPEAPKVAEISLWVDNPGPGPTQAFLACTIERASQTISYQSTPLDCCGATPGNWYPVTKFFSLPLSDEPMDKIFIYVVNPGKRTFLVDDMTVKFY